MADKKLQADSQEEIRLLRDLLIVQLALAGVPQHNIRSIAKVDMGYVTKIVKLLPKKSIGNSK